MTIDRAHRPPVVCPERSDASANRYLSRLRGLLNFAEEVGKRRSHISFKNIIAKEDPKQSYISFDEFMRVLDACYEVPKCNRWKRDRSFRGCSNPAP